MAQSVAHLAGADAVHDPRIPVSLDQLPDGVRMPYGAHCVFVSGSLVAGWGHASSDVDIYVVTEQAADLSSMADLDIGVTDARVPIAVTYDPNGVRYDVEYWTTAHVDALLDAVAWHDPDRPSGGPALTTAAVDCYHRISIGRALSGRAWLAGVKQRLAGSALRQLLAAHHFGEADGSLDDALGLSNLIGDDTTVARIPQARFRRVGAALLVAYGPVVVEISEVGALIWRLADGRRLVRQIVEGVLVEYDVAEDEARADTIEFLEEMLGHQLVRIVA
jgi:hypothetical protein